MNSETKHSLKHVLRLPIFWLLETVLVLALPFVYWVLLRFMQVPQEALVFSLVFAVIIGTCINLMASYNLLSQKLTLPQNQVNLSNIARIELISATPLVIGAIVAVYLVHSGDSDQTVYFLAPAIVLWFLIRRALRKKS